MKDVWIPCDKFLPEKEGAYLVTTAQEKIVIDRWTNGAWARCVPTVKGKGRYKPHKAWMFLPKPYKE